MKNTSKLLIVFFATALAFSMAACSSGGAGGGGSPAPSPSAPAEPTSTRFESKDADGNTYVLEITKASGSRAVYTPKAGDNYVLTINPGNKISRGTITNIDGDDLILQPSNTDSDPFTVTVEKTSTAALMTSIEGTITTDDGKTTTVTVEVIPVGTYETIKLTANIWEDGKAAGEAYLAVFGLSDFSTVIPQKGDVFKFMISGTTKTPLKKFSCELSIRPIGGGYQWLGGGGNYVELLTTFQDVIIEVEILNDPLPYEFIGIVISNSLWRKDENGEYIFNDGKFPAGTKQNDVIDTINNFKISLFEINRQ